MAQDTFPTAALLGFVVPGLGQMLKGHTGSLLTFYGAHLVNVVLAFVISAFLLPYVYVALAIAAALHVWSVVHAYRARQDGTRLGNSLVRFLDGPVGEAP